MMSFSNKHDQIVNPVREQMISPPPPIGGAGHFLRVSRKDEEDVRSEDPEFTHGQFLQARVIKKALTKEKSERLEIRIEGFSEPTNEREEVYKSELKLDTPNAIRAKLPDKTKMMCLIDTGTTETLMSVAGIQESVYLRDRERIPLKYPKKFLVGNGEYILAKSMMKFQIRINSTDFTIIAHIVPNIGGYKVVLGLNTLHDLKAEIDVSRAILKVKKTRIQVRPTKEYVLQPGQNTLISIRAQLPTPMKTWTLIVDMSDHFRKVGPSHCMVAMPNAIEVYNPSNRPIKLSHNMCVGYADTSAIGQIQQRLSLKADQGPEAMMVRNETGKDRKRQ
jgi:hypothetical protein